MRASLGDRVRAYLIDMIILLVLLGAINVLYGPDTKDIYGDMNANALKYFNGDISFMTYFKDNSVLYKEMDINNLFLNIINVIYIFLYFVIFPYFNKGKTVGMMILRLSFKGACCLKGLFLRCLVINGLLYLIVVILASVFVPGDLYFVFVSVLGFVQVVLVLVSIFMILFRDDRRGLHDLISSIWVAKE